MKKPSCGDNGGITRAGNPCKNRAGYKTTHVGQGKCFVHGGCAAGVIKHGQYVKSTTTGPLREKIQQHLADPDPLNLTPELALLRSLLDFFQEKLSSEDDEGNVTHIDPTRKDAESFLLLIQGIQKVADTISKIQTREVLTAREVEYLLVTLADILKGWDGKLFDSKAAARELQRRCQLPGLTTIEVITEA